MSAWFDVIKTDELSNGHWYVTEIEDVPIVIINLEDEYFALENICTHDGSELAGEPLEDNCIVCPYHGARFCIKTGKVLAPPAYEDLNTYPVRIFNHNIQVKI